MEYLPVYRDDERLLYEERGVVLDNDACSNLLFVMTKPAGLGVFSAGFEPILLYHARQIGSKSNWPADATRSFLPSSFHGGYTWIAFETCNRWANLALVPFLN